MFMFLCRRHKICRLFFLESWCFNWTTRITFKLVWVQFSFHQIRCFQSVWALYHNTLVYTLPCFMRCHFKQEEYIQTWFYVFGMGNIEMFYMDTSLNFTYHHFPSRSLSLSFQILGQWHVSNFITLTNQLFTPVSYWKINICPFDTSVFPEI